VEMAGPLDEMGIRNLMTERILEDFAETEDEREENSRRRTK
jgi:hypothetical protein